MKICGWNDDLKIVKVCCKKIGNSTTNTTPVYPLVPGHDCEDKTEMCKKWAENGACQVGRDYVLRRPEIQSSNRFILEQKVFDNIEIWDFMVTSCAYSCNFCGYKGCRNEHHKCESWARKGRCITNPFFMGHTCRESCGVCGFFSPENKLAQTTHKEELRDYTNMNRYNFDCGRFKQVKQVRSKRTSAGKELSQFFGNGGVFYISNIVFGGFVLKLTNQEISCEATLITDKFAISAAHCFDFSPSSESKIMIVLTINSLTSEKEVVEILRVFNHLQYKYPTLYNDIAILKLGRRIKYDYDITGVTPVCLKREAVQGEPTAKVVGRGITEKGTRGKMLETEVRIIPNKHCKQVFDNKVSVSKFPKGFPKQILCTASVKNSDEVFSGFCAGDIGGALSVEENGLKEAVGVANGRICCGKGYPGWYTRISEYIPWIDCVVAGLLENKRSQLVQTECGATAGDLVFDNNDDNIGFGLFDLPSLN